MWRELALGLAGRLGRLLRLAQLGAACFLDGDGGEVRECLDELDLVGRGLARLAISTPRRCPSTVRRSTERRPSDQQARRTVRQREYRQ